ncbi:hypothetical protein WMY93_031395, partial [Mugilogobius chulae]
MCPGSSVGSPTGGTCPEHLTRESSRSHLKQMTEPPLHHHLQSRLFGYYPKLMTTGEGWN